MFSLVRIEESTRSGGVTSYFPVRFPYRDFVLTSTPFLKAHGESVTSYFPAFIPPHSLQFPALNSSLGSKMF